MIAAEVLSALPADAPDREVDEETDAPENDAPAGPGNPCDSQGPRRGAPRVGSGGPDGAESDHRETGAIHTDPAGTSGRAGADGGNADGVDGAHREIRAIHADPEEGSRRAEPDGDAARAADLRGRFLPLEDQRDAEGPARVLHAAVELAGIAQTGPVSPFVTPLGEERHAALGAVARDLLQAEMQHREASGS